jgi:NAD(P)-dependent dehydrogenase (short-subunit alcohol dehydrogenase family)
MDLGLKGMTALVTGGGRGIGRGIALALADEGVDVAIASRDPDAATVAELAARGVRSLAIRADISVEADAERMVREAIAALGRLDLFVGNAGAHWHEAVTRLTSQNIRRTLATNLEGCMLATRDAARHMVERGSGSILLVASTIVLNPGFAESSYRVSKAGVRAFAETLAIELGPHNVRVNTLSPGIVRTRLAANVEAVMRHPTLGPSLLASVALRRLGDPLECGPAAAFLLSDRVAGYITGADLLVDGGFHLRPLTLMTEEEIIALNRI